MPDAEQVHHDLVGWQVLEPDVPIGFTRRFRGALARAASDLQAYQEAGEVSAGDPVWNQVRVALDAFLGPRHVEATPAHYAFVRAVHVATLPEAVRRVLGL